MKKKITSIILLFCMMASLLPIFNMTASAEPEADEAVFARNPEMDGETVNIIAAEYDGTLYAMGKEIPGQPGKRAAVAITVTDGADYPWRILVDKSQADTFTATAESYKYDSWGSSYMIAQFKTESGYLVDDEGTLSTVESTDANNSKWKFTWNKGYSNHATSRNLYLVIEGEDMYFAISSVSPDETHIIIERFHEDCKHTGIVHHPAVAFGCENDGNPEYWHCDICDEYFLDEDFLTSTWKSALVMPAIGHSDTNGDLICDNCGLPVTPLEFRKVTDASDITADGTYIIVDENGNIMGKPASADDGGKKGGADNINIPSVSVSPENNRYNYYQCKAAGALIFDLKHIMNYQEWGEDAGMVYGIHYDGLCLEFENGFYSVTQVEGAKYGIRAILQEDGFVNIDAHYDAHWNVASPDGYFLRSYTDDKLGATFTMQAQESATANKLFLYRMVECYTVDLVQVEGVVSVAIEVADKKATTDFSGEEAIDTPAANGGTNVTGITSALPGTYISEVVSDYMTSQAIPVDAETEISVEATVDVAASAYRVGESITFTLSPILNITGTSVPGEIPITDDDLNGTPMTVTLYTGDIIPTQVIHQKQDGTNEYFYPEYSDAVLNFGEKAFKLIESADRNTYVTFTVTEFSDITLCVDPKMEVAISLGSDITVNCYAKIYGYDDSVKMEFTMNGKKSVVSGTATGTENEYLFKFTKVAPQCIGDTIFSELKRGNAILYTRPDFTVKQYCNNLLGYTYADSDGNGKDDTTGYTADKFDAMKVLIKDLLIYGSAAQTYVGYKADALVSDGIEGTIFPTDITTITDVRDITQNIGDNKFEAMTLRFNNVNSLVYKFSATDISKVEIGIKAGEGTEQKFNTFVSLGDGHYLYVSDAISATEFNTAFTATIYTDGVAGAVVVYSVNSYIKVMQESDNENMKALAKATYNYGVSAVAFVG